MDQLSGLGYRAPFLSHLLEDSPRLGWLEVITENYLWDRGVRRKNLERLREKYDLAFHGVSLSLAGPEELDENYLRELAAFCHDFSPVRVSDHLSWSSTGAHHWHDLLPFPYTEENLVRISEKVLRWQDVLKRPLIVENLSAYVGTRLSTMSEYEFLAQLVKKTSCEILLDLNNMVVNARNFGTNPFSELEKIDLSSVAQVHLAGFMEGRDFVIDTHSRAPDPATWELWGKVVSLRSDIPCMIEWDADIPEFSKVMGLLDRAEEIRRENK